MSNGGRLGFVQEPDGRGTVGLLWHCLFTWFLCLWSLFYVNIPALNERKTSSVGRKVFYLVLGAVAPEWIATMAAIQYRNASLFVNQARGMNTVAHLPQVSVAPYEAQSEKALRGVDVKPIEHWTLRHGFYCGMGGFVIAKPEDPSNHFPVTGPQLLWLISNGFIQTPSITSDEIKDKSKQDSLTKTIVFGQTLWFVAQCIGRGFHGLPISTLEITTLAYVACMMLWMVFWWRKPYDIGLPTSLEIIHWPRGTSKQFDQMVPEIAFVLYRQVDLLHYPRVHNSPASDQPGFVERTGQLVLLLTVLLFGGVHCIAWNFDFPTELERWLWRASALFIVLSALVILLDHARQWYNGFIATQTRAWEYFSLVGSFAYVVVRMYLLAAVFLQFRAMPPGVYDTPNWSLYIPSF